MPYITAISLLNEIPTDGNSPIKIIGNDYQLYLAKNSRNKTPALDIINEVLAHHLLNCWDIVTPEAAIIKISPFDLRKEYSNYHKPSYYNKPVFGSSWLHDSIDCNALTVSVNKPDYKKFENPNSIFDIALFDIWIENDDRKPTNNNLLLQTFNGKQKIIPIDNAFIFSSLNYKDLNEQYVAFSDNDSIIRSDLAISLKKYKTSRSTWAKNDKEKFYLCIESSKKEFDEIAAIIPQKWGFTDVHKQKIISFLFNEKRNKQVFEQYLYLMK